MGNAASKRALERRLDETQRQLIAAQAECAKSNSLLLTIAWKDVHLNWYTAHGAKLRFALSDEDVARLEPAAERQGHLLYFSHDLHPLAEKLLKQREKRLEEEAERYGVSYPGDFASHTCDWRHGRELRSFDQVTLEAVRSHYLRYCIHLPYYMRSIERDDADWPAVWPWCRKKVLEEGWEWTPEVHNYWFGPSFRAEARVLKEVADLTRLAKTRAAECGPLEKT